MSNKQTYRVLLLAIVLFQGSWLFGQTTTEELKEHTVQQGQTLYSISREYGLTVDEILEANPDARQGISIDQVLYIPRPKAKAPEPQQTPTLPADFLQHTAQPKETLYAISRKYGVSIDDLKKYNPQLEDGLQIGEVLRFPRTNNRPTNTQTAPVQGATAPQELRDFETDQAKPVETKPTNNYKGPSVAHEVQQGETLFRLYQLYRVSMDSIRMANNGLKEGLKVGEVVLIPQPGGETEVNELSQAVEDSVATYDNGISYSDDSSNFQPVYNWALMLPFYLDMNDTMMVNRKPYEPMEIYKRSRDAIDFYQGLKLALDSLKTQGISIRLHVYDTNNDTNLVKALLQRREMKYMDLFIGPLYTDNFKLVSSFCKDKQIPQVCPVPKSNKILLGNEHISKVPGSPPAQVANVAAYTVRKYREENLFLVNTGHLSDQTLVEIYKARSRKVLNKLDSTSTDTIPEMRMYTPELNFLRSRLDTGKLNVLVVPTYRESYVIPLMAKLYRLNRDNYRTIVFGIDTWSRFVNKIDVKYLHASQLHLTDPDYVDLNDPEVLKLVGHFRETYHTDPSAKAISAFNIGWCYGRSMFELGRSFSTNMEDLKLDGIGQQFRFHKTGPESGYENYSTSILKYEDYQLIKVR